jgi:hypothetical protein
MAKCTECGTQFITLDGEEWKKLCIQCWRKSKGIPEPNTKQHFSNSMIEPEMLKRLIFLCHPDKHFGSVASTLATEWLILQRN